MTFRQWLRQQENRDDLIGDLARDAGHDPNAPQAGTEWPDYLISADACLGAISALESALEEYNRLKPQGATRPVVDKRIYTILMTFGYESIVFCNDVSDAPRDSGLYFLYAGNTLEYIGQSIDIRQRLRHHARYDRGRHQIGAVFRIIGRRRREAIEAALINLLKPCLNRKWKSDGVS